MPNHPNTSELELRARCEACGTKTPFTLDLSKRDEKIAATAQAQGRREGVQLAIDKLKASGYHDEEDSIRELHKLLAGHTGQPKTVTSVSGDTPENRSNTEQGTVTPCPTCKGSGNIEGHFMAKWPNEYPECPDCHGQPITS